MTRLTVREAADYLRFAKSTLDNWRSKGRGPRFSKLGKKILYDVRDLDKWFDDNRRNSTSDQPQLRRRRRRSRLGNPLDVSR
jgi:predicted DNA-binding transcriptional regulator AlpA